MINYIKIKTFNNSYNKIYDVGLRYYMLKVYNYMALSLIITGIMAFITINFKPLTILMFNITPYGQISSTGLGSLIMVAPVGIALYFFMGFGNITLDSAKILFWMYSIFTGMSLSSLSLIYTGESIVRTFFICSSVFSGMSLYGYTTNKDLTSISSFFIMGLLGLFIASLVNLFLHSSVLYFITSIIGVFVFIFLVAWDTQKIKSIYFKYGECTSDLSQKVALMASFILYLDFINLFLYFIRFLGNRKD